MVKRAPADGGLPLLSEFLSGTAVYCGTTSTTVTVPSGATSALITAAGAALYWNVNGSSAGTTSPGYVAADMNGFIPPIDNFSALHVKGAGTATVAYVSFFED